MVTVSVMNFFPSWERVRLPVALGYEVAVFGKVNVAPFVTDVGVTFRLNARPIGNGVEVLALVAVK
jgi:hypothetical protein